MIIAPYLALWGAATLPSLPARCSLLQRPHAERCQRTCIRCLTSLPHQVLVTALVLTWGCRLTRNWCIRYERA